MKCNKKFDPWVVKNEEKIRDPIEIGSTLEASKDNLKEKLSMDALPMLTKKILIPLSRSVPLNPSERDIFYNTTGCLR